MTRIRAPDAELRDTWLSGQVMPPAAKTERILGVDSARTRTIFRWFLGDVLMVFRFFQVVFRLFSGCFQVVFGGCSDGFEWICSKKMRRKEGKMQQKPWDLLHQNPKKQGLWLDAANSWLDAFSRGYSQVSAKTWRVQAPKASKTTIQKVRQKWGAHKEHGHRLKGSVLFCCSSWYMSHDEPRSLTNPFDTTSLQVIPLV